MIAELHSGPKGRKAEPHTHRKSTEIGKPWTWVYMVIINANIIDTGHPWSIDSCQHKVSADQYHMTISRTQVYNSSRWPLKKLTADRKMGFLLDRGLKTIFLCQWSVNSDI